MSWDGEVQKQRALSTAQHSFSLKLERTWVRSINLFTYYFKSETQRVRFIAHSQCLQQSRENHNVTFGHRQEKVQGREAPDSDAHTTFGTVCCQMPECAKFHFLPAPRRVLMARMQHRTASHEQVKHQKHLVRLWLEWWLWVLKNYLNIHWNKPLSVGFWWRFLVFIFNSL